MTTIERLRNPMPRDAVGAWITTATITLLAFFIRVVNVGYPKNLLFDETYYAKDAWTLLKFGYERDWDGKDANAAILTGQFDHVIKSTGEFAVHPPMGKWLIAIGEWMFGMNAFGWRIMSVVFGAALVAVTIRLTRRLSRSTLIGALAGLLLTLDGLHFVMSRIALLDIFQAFFVVAGVSAMLADRDWFRDRLADHLESHGLVDLGGRFGPVLWWRPWRLVAGVLFGCAIATKWNSMYVLASMCVLTLLWDVSARRLAGADAHAWWGLLRDGIPAFCWQVVVAGLVYVTTWVRWFQTSGGYDRQWGAQHPDHWSTKLLGNPIASWIHLHQDIYGFHVGSYIKSQTHPYDAHPAGWLVMARTIGIDAVNDIKPGDQGCPPHGDTCLRVIDGMGTPLLWWLGAIALVAGLVLWLGGKDWRFSVPLVGLCSTWIPWWFSADRPVFFFYCIMLIPFTCISLAMVMGKILGPADRPQRRQVGAVIVGAAVALICLNFAFIYPVISDRLLPRWQWALRMWLVSWI